MRTHGIDLPGLDARAVRASVAVAARVTPADLGRPTPCGEWDVAALLAHMTVQHRGFAASARGAGQDLRIWQPQPLAADPAADYADAADDVIAAFAGDGDQDRPFALPEVRPDPIPFRLAVGFHLVDYVVHGWDLAVALGLPYTTPYAPDADVVAAALPVAEAVPDGGNRLRPGASFAPRLTPPPDADPLTRILTLLGRSPSWSPDSAGVR